MRALSGYIPTQQTLRTTIEMVALDVLVLDKDRHPVRGLRQEDFTIVEDGQIRPTLVFAAVDLPLPGLAERTVAAGPRGVVTNEPDDQGRLVVIVFDRSIPAGPPTITAKAIARATIETLGPRDLAAVVRTSGFSNEGKSQNFTRDRELLLGAVDSAFTGLISPPSMTVGGLRDPIPDLELTGDCI